MLIGFGGNDCDYRWKRIIHVTFPDLNSGTPPPGFRRNISTMVDMIGDAGVVPLLVNLPPIISEFNLSHLIPDENERFCVAAMLDGTHNHFDCTGNTVKRSRGLLSVTRFL